MSLNGFIQFLFADKTRLAVLFCCTPWAGPNFPTDFSGRSRAADSSSRSDNEEWGKLVSEQGRKIREKAWRAAGGRTFEDAYKPRK